MSGALYDVWALMPDKSDRGHGWSRLNSRPLDEREAEVYRATLGFRVRVTTAAER